MLIQGGISFMIRHSCPYILYSSVRLGCLNVNGWYSSAATELSYVNCLTKEFETFNNSLKI